MGTHTDVSTRDDLITGATVYETEERIFYVEVNLFEEGIEVSAKGGPILDPEAARKLAGYIIAVADTFEAKK